MATGRLVKRDTRRAIDTIIDYFGDSTATPGGTFGQRLGDLLERKDAPALVPVPIARPAGTRPSAPSSGVRRFA
jgi:hypothetical protein